MALTAGSQRFPFSGMTPVIAVCTVISGALAGWATAQFGPLPTLGAVGAAVLAVISLRTVWAPYAAVIAIGLMLPFFVIPVSIGSAQPTLFELAVIAAIGSYAIVMLIDRRLRLVTRTEICLWLLFLSYIVCAFLLGSRFGAGADLVRLFTRFGLAFLLFWLTVQLVRSRSISRHIIEWVVTVSTASASFALLLYAGGPGLTFRVLSKLVPYGYPDTRIVRFIEDNPSNAMRAVGTSVDPNAFGGLLMLGFVMAVGLLFSQNRRLPVPLYWFATGVIGVALLLTFSRGAWVGAAAGSGIIVWFRARYLVPVGGIGAVLLLGAGIGVTFVSRLEAGIRIEDAATLQRFNEYDNALAIIREHPWFGIGFGSAPSPEFGVGVSSIYLLIAEQTGLIGLSLFVLFAIVVLRRAWHVFLATNDDLLLIVGATFVAALVVGLVDHYFFNIRFAHSVGFFWIVVGMLVALSGSEVVAAHVNDEGKVQ